MGIDFSNFQQVFQFVIAHSYVMIFLLMCIEGPTITAAATFAATLGYFNPLIIFVLSLLGDIVPDVIYYWIGRWGGIPFAQKIGKKFGLSEKRIAKMIEKISEHGGKTVAILKYTPVLATPGLMLVGAVHMNWWRFFNFVFLVTLQKTLTFMALGYFAGKAYDIGKYIKFGTLIPFVIVVIYFLAAFLYKKISKKIIAKIEKI
jgi:membrane protein DedA with SNARE-associated domain